MAYMMVNLALKLKNERSKIIFQKVTNPS